MNKKHYLIIFCGVLLDQISKQISERTLSFVEPIMVIPKMFYFQLVHNYGAAYGILQNQRVFLLSVSVIVIFICFVFSRYIATSKWSAYGISFILIGAIGNCLDRFFLGYVIDFIDIKIFPVFNVADVCIDIGIAYFILEFMLQYGHDKSNSVSS